MPSFYTRNPKQSTFNRAERRRAEREYRRIRDTARRAGVVFDRPISPHDIIYWPWKADDRAWFAEHPDRAHRLREAHPGEMDTAPVVQIEEGYVWRILVRQVSPGNRVRVCVPFRQNVAVSLSPDDENLIRALFDLSASRARLRGGFDVEQAIALAVEYETAERRVPS